MTLAALIRGKRIAASAKPATATSATPATVEPGKIRTVAKVATVAVANLPEAEARRQRVLTILAGNPALRLAVVCDAEGDPVPVAVAIRDKGTCEVLIPATRFDPFALLDLIARHSGTMH